MPIPTTPASGAGVRYDPLPLTTEHDQPALHPPYDRSHADSPAYSSGTPAELSVEDLGVPQPRFLSRAAGGQPGDPQVRDSIAGSEYTAAHGSDFGSTYAFDPNSLGSGQRPEYSRATTYSAYRDDPYAAEGAAAAPMEPYGGASEKARAYPPPAGRRSRRRVYIIAGAVALLLLVLAVIIPLYFAVIKPKSNSSKSSSSTSSGSGSGSGSGSSGGGKNSGSKLAITGGDGSTVTTDDGSTFTYHNSFGGTWYFDENDPFNNAAQAQSWTPALNESFNWGTDIIRG
jgi:glucan 1,3-beta-glucosidase